MATFCLYIGLEGVPNLIYQPPPGATEIHNQPLNVFSTILFLTTSHHHLKACLNHQPIQLHFPQAPHIATISSHMSQASPLTLIPHYLILTITPPLHKNISSLIKLSHPSKPQRAQIFTPNHPLGCTLYSFFLSFIKELKYMKIFY